MVDAGIIHSGHRRVPHFWSAMEPASVCCPSLESTARQSALLSIQPVAIENPSRPSQSHVSNSVSSSRKLTWIPFHLCLTPLACCLFSCARRAHHFTLVSLHSVCFPGFSASLGRIRNSHSSSETIWTPLVTSVSTSFLLALPMTPKGSRIESINF